MTRLSELATVVRSKNAGPCQLTFDVFFEDDESYQRVVDSGAINPVAVASLFDVPQEAILGIYELNQILAVKISIRRTVPAGDPGDTDVYGAQQHTPLLTLDI